MTTREVQLALQPEGDLTADHFEVVETDLGSPGPGKVLVRLRRLGLNAGLAHRIGVEGTAYGPGIGVGDVPASDGVLEILESNDPAFRVGELVVGKSPWRTESVIAASELRAIPTPDSDLTPYLTILGHAGHRLSVLSGRRRRYRC